MMEAYLLEGEGEGEGAGGKEKEGKTLMTNFWPSLQ